jgi:hypothetical protein
MPPALADVPAGRDDGGTMQREDVATIRRPATTAPSDESVRLEHDGSLDRSAARSAGRASYLPEAAMRRIAFALPGLVAVTLAVHPSAQGIFREPARGTRAVEVVEGARRPPVELTRAEVRLDPIGPDGFVLRALARQSGTGPRWDRLEVRLAFRLADGVRTYPLATRSDSPGTRDEWVPVAFRLAPQTPAPSLLEWSAKTPVALTVERITTADGTELWANPDARDRLWQELWATPVHPTPPGRPPRE